MIIVRKYTKQDKVLWDEFIDVAKNSTFLFKRDYMEYHKDRFEDYSLLVLENDNLIAALPAHTINENCIASHLGLSYGGIILRRTETLQKTILIFHEILFYLKSNRISTVTYKSFHKFYNSIASEELSYAKFLAKAELSKRQISSVINLQDKLELSKTRKRYIRRANKIGILIREVTKFDDYWNEILIPNLRTKFDVSPTHTLDEITKLKSIFPSHIRQFNAYLNDKIVAGATIFETPNVVKVQYNSANEEGRITGASDLLYGTLIEDTFKHKHYLDFGTSFDSYGLNNGLLIWKESFGARAFAIDTYEIKTKNHVFLEQSMQIQNVGDLAKQ